MAQNTISACISEVLIKQCKYVAVLKKEDIIRQIQSTPIIRIPKIERLPLNDDTDMVTVKYDDVTLRFHFHWKKSQDETRLVVRDIVPLEEEKE